MSANDATQPTCCICGEPIERDWAGNAWPFTTGYGHNPEPVKKESDGQCCDECNDTRVIPAQQQAVKQGKG
jgi:hypothetical protein